jgi:hypothetical protein
MALGISETRRLSGSAHSASVRLATITWRLARTTRWILSPSSERTAGMRCCAYPTWKASSKSTTTRVLRNSPRSKAKGR